LGRWFCADVLHGEVVEIQLSLQRGEVLGPRLDGVDPDPVAFLEAGQLLTKLVERYRVSAKGPVPEDVCVHLRSVPESGSG
jgi:hypothetical protein